MVALFLTILTTICIYILLQYRPPSSRYYIKGETENTYKNLLSSWSSPLLMDISLTKKKNYKSIFKFKYAGTQEGCLLDDGKLPIIESKFFYDQGHSEKSALIYYVEKLPKC